MVFRATVSIKLSSLFFAYSGCILKNSLTSSKLGKSEGAEHMKRNYRTKRSSAFFLLFQCLYIHTYVLQTYRRHADIQKDRQADINTHTHTHIYRHTDTQTHRHTDEHRRQTHRRQTHTHILCIYIWYMCAKVRTYIRTSIPPLLPSIHPCLHEGRRNLQISHNETV